MLLVMKSVVKKKKKKFQQCVFGTDFSLVFGLTIGIIS